MLRLFFACAVCVAIAESSYILSNSFVVRLSDPKAGFKQLKALGYRIKLLSDTHLLIERGASSTKVYSISDEIECLELKLAVTSVEECSPNHIYSLSSTVTDTLLPHQWGLRMVEAGEQVWHQVDGDSIVVAVTDTGVDYTHPDLSENIFFNTAEIPNDGIDNDNNGYVDDVVGWSGVTNNGFTLDRHGHGTHVAGIIAAAINGFGVIGVAPRAKVLPIKILNDQGYGNLGTIVAGLNYIKTLKTHGVNIRVINASWGGGAHNNILQNLILELHDLGIVFVAAAGNSASNNDQQPTYPANYEKALSVASLDESRQVSFFSNYGNSVHIGAPGSAVVSTLPNSRYGSMSGTSMAAPFVSGALALLFQKHPSFSASEAVLMLLDTCPKNGELTDKIRHGCTLNVRTLMSGESQPPPNFTPDNFRLIRNLDSLSFGDFTLASTPLQFSNNDEGEAQVRVNNLTYNGVPVNTITVSSNFLIYFNGKRNIFDFLSVSELFGKLKQTVSLLSSDWIVKRALHSTNSDGAHIYMEGQHYENRAAEIKVGFSMYERGGFKIRYAINKQTWNSDLRNELRFVFFGNSTSRRYANFRPLYRVATLNLASADNQNLQVDKLSLGANESGVAVSVAGAGSGAIYGYFFVNGQKCQRRVPVAMVKGSGRRLSVLNQLPNYSVIFRANLPDNVSRRVKLNRRIHLTNSNRMSVQQACKLLTG